MANSLLIVLIVLGVFGISVAFSLAAVVIEEVIETVRLHRKEFKRRK